jgi:hypothetical protein
VVKTDNYCNPCKRLQLLCKPMSIKQIRARLAQPSCNGKLKSPPTKRSPLGEVGEAVTVIPRLSPRTDGSADHETARGDCELDLMKVVVSTSTGCPEERDSTARQVASVVDTI